FGAPQFYRAAAKAGIKAIVGAELTMRAEEAGRGPSARGDARGALPGVVASGAGYRPLCPAIPRGEMRAPQGEAILTLEDFQGQTDGLIALVGREALRADRHGVGGLVDQVVGLFGRQQVWIELQRHLNRDEAGDLGSLLDLGAAFRVPVM